MKCLITGHTRGIGNFLYNNLPNHGISVDGISRSNGYDVVENQDAIVNKALNYDLFINNAYAPGCQYKLLEALNNRVKNIITIGSVAAFYHDLPSRKQYYAVDKNNLVNLNKRFSYNSTSNLLLINVGSTENSSSDPGCSYMDILNACIFWLKTPTVNQIDFGIKLSQTNIDLIETDFRFKLKDFPTKFF